MRGTSINDDEDFADFNDDDIRGSQSDRRSNSRVRAPRNSRKAGAALTRNDLQFYCEPDQKNVNTARQIAAYEMSSNVGWLHNKVDKERLHDVAREALSEASAKNGHGELTFYGGGHITDTSSSYRERSLYHCARKYLRLLLPSCTTIDNGRFRF